MTDVQNQVIMTQQGSGIKEWLHKAHDYTKKNKLVSRSLNALGYTQYGALASMAGYGKKKRKSKKK